VTALVLLPGMDGSGHFFADFCRRLGPHVAPVVIAYPQDQALDYLGLTDFVRGRLPAGLAVPVLYLQAAQDRVVLASAGRHLSSLLPALKLVRIDGPHLLLQAALDAAGAAVKAFIAEHRRQGAPEQAAISP
jgi:pimeloyl-ACP methyl ester carboxylesterase